MKNSTLNTIYTALTNYNFDNTEVMDELYNELHRGDARKAKNAEVYDGIHDLIISNMDVKPMTCGEIYDAIKDNLPEGVGRGKVQYALTHLWQDEIVKIEGKPNTYRLA